MNSLKKHDFVQINLASHKNANEKVLNFIADFIYYQPNNEKIVNQFRAGYCYHFAQILKNTFNRGEICWAAPFGHILWQDDNKICYDIEGVYSGEADFIIPIEYIEDGIKDFLRIPGEGFDVTQEDINKYIKDYLFDNPDEITSEYKHLISQEDVEEFYNKINDLRKESKEIELNYGYYVHRLTDDITIKSIHTHGLLRNFSHPELEVICIKENNSTMEQIIHYIASLIRDFSLSLKNKEYNITVNNNRIKIVALLVSNNDINIAPYYRIILRDPNGKYPWDDDCNEEYKIQWSEKDQISHQELLEY